MRVVQCHVDGTLQQRESSQIINRLLERAGPERERKGRPRLQQLLPADAEIAPANVVIAEPELTSLLRLQNGNDIVFRSGAPSDGRGNEKVEEAEHYRRWCRLLVRQRVSASPGMMQPRRRLESHVAFGTGHQKARDLPCVRKRLAAHAAAA